MKQTPAPARRFVHPSSSSTQPAASVKKSAPPFFQARASGVSASPYSRASQFSARGPSQKDEIITSFGDDQKSPLSHDKPHTAFVDDEVHYDEEAEDDWLRADFGTPMPKRRKVTRRQAAASEPIQISSSPSDTAPQSPDLSDAEDRNLSAIGYATPQTTSRFRTPVALLTAEDTRPSKPAFKPIDHGSLALGNMNSVLPEAFTPSRKKGKPDYVPGGLADTLRSWILQVSTDESQRDGKDEPDILVKEAALDRSGRVIAISADDERQWLLTGPQPWSSSSISKDSVTRISERGKVVVHGTSTHWHVPLETLGQGPDIQVVGQWDLPP